jgi:hypothetical protein
MSYEQHEPAILRVGDTVKWKGSFGADAYEFAQVMCIELCEPGNKYGDEVEAVPWAVCGSREVVVNLDNGHWAYGTQIAPKL